MDKSNTDAMQSILERLKMARKTSKMSQDEVGGYFGWSGKNIGHYETGRTPIHMQTFLFMCELYNVDPAEIISGKPRQAVQRGINGLNGHKNEPVLSDSEVKALHMILNTFKTNMSSIGDGMELLEDLLKKVAQSE